MESLQVLMSCREVTLTVSNTWLGVTWYEHSIIPLYHNKSLLPQSHDSKYSSCKQFIQSHVWRNRVVFVPVAHLKLWHYLKASRGKYSMLGHCWIFHLQPNQSWIIESSNSLNISRVCERCDMICKVTMFVRRPTWVHQYPSALLSFRVNRGGWLIAAAMWSGVWVKIKKKFHHVG